MQHGKAETKQPAVVPGNAHSDSIDDEPLGLGFGLGEKKQRDEEGERESLQQHKEVA